MNPNKIRRLCASMICSKDVARFGQPSESGEADHTGRSGPALGLRHAYVALPTCFVYVAVLLDAW
ncbi:MAG: hypothetical protein E5Y51_03030 [Mesorhizobium sp.]|nr:MAG: hypothetical protein E5Y51_03030 [Mesorhizobium sp.]